MPLQAGLPPPFWWLAVPCYCFHENVRDEGGTSAYYRRTGEHFGGQLIPFGARVSFRPLSTSMVYKHKLKFGSAGYPGIFLGYECNFGERWNKNYLVAAIDCFEDLPLLLCTPPRLCKVVVQAVAEVKPWFRGLEQDRGASGSALMWDPPISGTSGPAGVDPDDGL